MNGYPVNHNGAHEDAAGRVFDQPFHDFTTLDSNTTQLDYTAFGDFDPDPGPSVSASRYSVMTT